jgi:hypothetical protein
MKTWPSFSKRCCGFLSVAAALLPVLVLGQNTYTPYTFITFAGSPGLSGYVDGTNGTARFDVPGGVAVDVSNNVYVADQGNNIIRKITPGGVVTTIAGTYYSIFPFQKFQDGTNAAAFFAQPSGVALDSAGNLYVGQIGLQPRLQVVVRAVRMAQTAPRGSLILTTWRLMAQAIFSWLTTDGVFLALAVARFAKSRQSAQIGWSRQLPDRRACRELQTERTTLPCSGFHGASPLTTTATCLWRTTTRSGKLHLSGRIGS